MASETAPGSLDDISRQTPEHALSDAGPAADALDPFEQEARVAEAPETDPTAAEPEAAGAPEPAPALEETATETETSEIETEDAARDPDAAQDLARPTDRVAPGTMVRPTRPSQRPAGSDRPRVAPLMLVSEQRVDTSQRSEPSQDAPVRPRRVTRGRLSLEAESAELGEQADQSASGMVANDEEAAGIFASSAGFAEFAEKMGAKGLSDLLECAAAYSSYVEGRPHFSHPEIMRVVRTGIESQQDLSREDSLRTFGQLLRQGKIRKVDRGQFTISKASRYMQEARSAAQ